MLYSISNIKYTKHWQWLIKLSENVSDVFMALAMIFIQCVVQLLPKELRESKSYLVREICYLDRRR